MFFEDQFVALVSVCMQNAPQFLVLPVFGLMKLLALQRLHLLACLFIPGSSYLLSSSRECHWRLM